MRFPLFEAFRTEDYYQRIDLETFYDEEDRLEAGDLLTPFTPTERTQVWGCFNSHDYYPELGTEANVINIKSDKGAGNIYLLKNEHEYYYVKLYLYRDKYDTQCYKCDQLDGLLRLLHDQKKYING